MSHLLRGALCLSLALASSQCSGAVIASWDFSTITSGGGGTAGANYGPSPFYATSISSLIQSARIIRGDGVTTTGTGAANGLGGNGFITTNQTDAITFNDFFTVSIVPQSGAIASFSSIAPYNVRRSSTGPTTGIWQFQVGSSSFTDIGSAIPWGTTTTAAGNTQSLIDLSGIAALQNVSDVVNFRVVNWGGTAAGGTWYLNGIGNTIAPDFTISGSVSSLPPPSVTAVPEPSSSLVFLAVAASAGGYRRFRRSFRADLSPS